MQKQKNVLEGSLHIVARALSENYRVKVVVGGDRACTDGKIIRVPSLPANDEIARVLAFGYIPHESAHIIWTDMQQWQTLKDDDVYRHVSNILEDIRIEANMMRKYPGAKTSLAKLVSQMVSDGSFGPPTNEWSEARLMQGYMLYRLRRDVLSQAALDELANAAERLLEEKFSRGVTTRLSALMYEVTNCDSTKQVLALAKRIIQAMQDEAEKKEDENPEPSAANGAGQESAGEQQPSQQGQDSPSDGEGQDGEGNGSQGDGKNGGQGTGKDDSAANEPPNPQGPDDQNGEDAKGNAADPSAGDGDGSEQGPGAGSAKAQADAIRKALNPAAGDGYKDLGDILREKLQARAADAPYSLGEPKANRLRASDGDGPALVSKVRRETNALRTRMQHMLQSMAMSKPFAACVGPRIEPARLYRIKLGNTKVYRKLVEGVKVNTAVQVIIDRSGSMSDKIDFTLETAASIALAMDHLKGVTSSVAIFPAPAGYSAQVLTDFGEGIRRTINAYPKVVATGGTPMAEALLWAGLNISQVNKPRKIVLVVTDGDPNNSEAVGDVRDDLVRMGIEVMGLGIQCSTAHLFTPSTMIHSIQELPKAVFGMLKTALFQRKVA